MEKFFSKLFNEKTKKMVPLLESLSVRNNSMYGGLISIYCLSQAITALLLLKIVKRPRRIRPKLDCRQQKLSLKQKEFTQHYTYPFIQVSRHGKLLVSSYQRVLILITMSRTNVPPKGRILCIMLSLSKTHTWLL